jgi:hypothetical protein
MIISTDQQLIGFALFRGDSYGRLLKWHRKSSRPKQ